MSPTPESVVDVTYPTHAPAWAERFGEDDFGIFAGFRVEQVGFLFRWIPPGRCLMGSLEDEEGRFKCEGPVHEVVIRAGFWLGETPVTQDQWRAVVETMGPDAPLNVLDSKPSHIKGPGTLPVQTVSWEDCVAFNGMLTIGMASAEVESPTFRLPTEAEWEYACRAGTTTRWSFGDDEAALEQHAWYDKNADGQTHPVGLKRANGWGLKDMHGGVFEWCSDWYGAYSNDQAVDPPGPENGSNCVVRGGSWYDSARGCRSAYRDFVDPGGRGINLGFRLVLAPQVGFLEAELGTVGQRRRSGGLRRKRSDDGARVGSFKIQV